MANHTRYVQRDGMSIVYKQNLLYDDRKRYKNYNNKKKTEPEKNRLLKEIMFLNKDIYNYQQMYT